MRWTRVAVLSTAFALAVSACLAAPLALKALHRVHSLPTGPAPVRHYPMGFRHIGFGEIDTCGSARYPSIERLQRGRATTLLVKASVACGLEVRRPASYVQGNTLHLSYETHFTGSVDMCECEYRSVFTFVGLPASVTNVEFSQEFVDSAP